MISKYINKLIYNRKMKTLEKRLESIEESLSAIREKIAPKQKEEEPTTFQDLCKDYPDLINEARRIDRLLNLPLDAHVPVDDLYRRMRWLERTVSLRKESKEKNDLKRLLKSDLLSLKEGKANFSSEQIKNIAKQIVEMCPAEKKFMLYSFAALQTIDPDMQYLADRIMYSLNEKEVRNRRFIHNTEEAYDYIIQLLDL